MISLEELLREPTPCEAALLSSELAYIIEDLFRQMVALLSRASRDVPSLRVAAKMTGGQIKAASALGDAIGELSKDIHEGGPDTDRWCLVRMYDALSLAAEPFIDGHLRNLDERTRESIEARCRELYLVMGDIADYQELIPC